MGSTIGVVLILAMLFTMWATRERRERWKSISFLSRLRLSDPSIFLFSIWSFMPSIKGEIWMPLRASRLSISMNCSQIVAWCWSYQRPPLGLLSALIRQWLEPLEPFISTNRREVRRTFALYQQHSYGSARRYDRGQLLDSLYDGEVPARFPICLASHVAFSIPIVVLMVLPTTQGNEPGYGQCCLWLGRLPSANAQRDHVAVSDIAAIAGYFMALYLFVLTTLPWPSL